MAQIPAGANRPGRLTRKQTGADFEHKARAWLERQGLRFVAANVYQRGGEIDLIMMHQRVIVFVEVRYRQSAQFGGAAASITRAKQQKVMRSAQQWLAGRGESFDTVDCRFDVIACNGDEIEWIPNAFAL